MLVEEKYLEKRLNDAVELYMTVINGLQTDDLMSRLDRTSKDNAVCALATEINKNLSLLKPAEKAIVEQRLTALRVRLDCQNPNSGIPPLRELVDPKFSFTIYFYDKIGADMAPKNFNWTALPVPFFHLIVPLPLSSQGGADRK
jgi:hypothetical protein